MIWVAGEVIPDDGLTINASDRTFEHGLGLFETMRTWGGRPTFLEAHRARMLGSAEALGIPIDPSRFPGEEDVARLLEADGKAGDQALRITATGGSPTAGSVVWMRARGLEHPAPKAAVRIELGRWVVDHDDPLARHKSLNYWNRRIAHEDAARRGFDETLGSSPGAGYCEGSYSNVFAIRDGRLITPTLEGPILPGLMRRFVIELAGEISIETREVRGMAASLVLGADEIFLTNSVRGIVPVGRAEEARSGDAHDWPAPGPLTRQLQAILLDRLLPGSHRP